MEENKSTSNIELGTLYDVNKNIILNHATALTEGELNSKKEIVKNFITDTGNFYYMLLCNERKDYTVFDFHYYGGNVKNNGTQIQCAKCLVDECLTNRGEIRAIDLTKDKDAIEIWMVIDNDAYVYYFFPYDNGVIADF